MLAQRCLQRHLLGRRCAAVHNKLLTGLFERIEIVGSVDGRIVGVEGLRIPRQGLPSRLPMPRIWCWESSLRVAV